LIIILRPVLYNENMPVNGGVQDVSMPVSIIDVEIS